MNQLCFAYWRIYASLGHNELTIAQLPFSSIVTNFLRVSFCREHAYALVLHITQHTNIAQTHDDVIQWKHFPRYWTFVRGIHRSPVNSPHKGQWRGTLMCSSICTWTNGWVNNRNAGNLKRHRAHYYVIVMHWDAPLWKSMSSLS